MANYKQLFTSHLDREGVKYSSLDERAVKLTYGTDNVSKVEVFVLFDKDGENLVTFRSWGFASFKGDKAEIGYKVCNDLNDQYRWVKFYIDKDGDVNAQIDAVVDGVTCGEECLQLVQRMVGIVDKAYPVLMKAIWS